MTGTVIESNFENEAMAITTEYGEPITLKIIASDGAGHYACEYNAGDRWHAVEIADFEDGIEIYEKDEGTTFDDECSTDAYTVVRTDNAGSTKWQSNYDE